MNFTEFKKEYLAIIEAQPPRQLEALHLIIYQSVPNANVIRRNLRKFTGFIPSKFEVNLKYAREQTSLIDIRRICDLFQISYDYNDEHKHLSYQVLQKLTVQEDQTATRKEEKDARSVISSTTSEQVTICENIEKANQEHLKVQTEICDLEERCENLQRQKESTEEQQIELRSTERKLRILNVKNSTLLAKMRTLETKFEEVRSRSSRKSQSYQQSECKADFTKKWVEATSIKAAKEFEDDVDSQQEMALTSELKDLKGTVASMLTRQSVGISLPDFDGKSPLAWNNFKMQYQLSTEQCRVSNKENILRLNKHLKGDAKTKVDLLLLSSKDPTKIIEILDYHYGGPERVLQELVNKAQDVKTVDTLEKFADFNCTVQNVACAIDDIDGDLFDIQKMLAIFLKKLPEHIVLQWASHLTISSVDSKKVSFQYFSKWIQNISTTVTNVTFYSNLKTLNYEDDLRSSLKYASPKQSKQETNITRNCKLCNDGEHHLEKCPSFLKLAVNKRWDVVKKHHACFSCLRYHRGPCKKKEICKIPGCSRFHHDLLHKVDGSRSSDNVASCINECSQKVLLKMLHVKLKGPGGVLDVLAFLDEGSTVTLLDRSISDKLLLTGETNSFCFKWTADIFRHEPDSKTVQAEISAGKGDTYFNLDEIKTVTNLELPTQNINIETLVNRFPDMKNFNVSPDMYTQRPMLLIGQRHAGLIASREIIELGDSGTLLSKTRLGWAIHGPVMMQKDSSNNFMCCPTVEENMDELLKQHFKLESFGVCLSKEDLTKSNEDRRAITIAENSIKKIGSHFEVALPWKEDDIRLPDSKPMAFQRFKCLERKLGKCPDLARAYEEQIQKLLDKGYARKISFKSLENKPKLWFLPHFAVVNPKKPQKPPRVVFDGAAKVNGLSINDFLLPGPDWLISIIGVLIRFRQNSIGFSGDIMEMFNRVQIIDEDTFAQCFLWRTRDQIEVYQMKAMLFGITSSPFLAQFVKNHNARLHKDEFPEAYDAIVRNHYVDDFLGSTNTEEEAIKLVNDVIHVHSQGGFTIRSFISNNQQVLQNIPKELVSTEMSTDIDTYQADQHILGVTWDAQKDEFKFIFKFSRVNSNVMSGSKIPTKRDVLKATMSVYDPLGFITPVTIQARLLMRKIWISGIGWDDELQEDLYVLWKKWLNDMKEVTDLRIPRCYNHNKKDVVKIELHIFNDASQVAYCAAAYLRFVMKHSINVSLVFSKSRVTPTSNKNMTIPKLELLAAVMGIRIAKTVEMEMDFKMDEVFYWTDSTTVLSWIHSAKALKSFEATRVGEILENSDKNQWNWLSTKVNIADQGTRENHSSLLSDSQWFNGPKFLYCNQNQWEEITGKWDFSKIKLEEKVMSITICDNNNEYLPNIYKYSSFQKLVKVTAWMGRFIYNSRCTTETRRQGPLTVKEINWSIIKWTRQVQKECFKDDFTRAKTGHGKPTRLSKFKIDIQEDDVMRISGRLDRAKCLPIETRRPLILDGDHPFTRLLVMNLHEKSSHVFHQVVVNKFKMGYWMPKMSSKIKTIIRSCNHCKIRSSKPSFPQMGLLPTERFYTFEKPFHACGIDYFGPFYVKNGRKVETRYGVLFTCLTTRAIHVEIAFSLTTDSCIMAVRRMMSRRGQIRIMWSDNGTNLRGASRELIEALEEMYPELAKAEVLKYGIDWNFIPPSSPHFGGCWERLIGCFKRSLESVISVNRNPSDEVLLTVFAEAETLVNSRPYVLESDDPDDELGITPNDILVSKNVTIQRSGNFNVNDCFLRKQWRVSQYLIDMFWKKFIHDYIPSLLTHKKWTTPTSNLKVGEIVVLKEPTARGNWPKGIVKAVYPGNDGIVRTVDVKTSHGIYRRPSIKVYRTNICTVPTIV